MRRKKLIGTVVVVLVLILIFSFAYLPARIVKSSRDSAGRVAEAHQVRKEISDISDALRAVVYHHRNFIFTGVDPYREDRNHDIFRLLNEIEGVTQLLRHDEVENSNVSELSSIVVNTFLPALLADDLVIRKTHEHARLMGLLAHDELFRSLLGRIAELDRDQQTQLELRQREFAETVRSDSLISLSLCAIAIGLLISLCFLYKIGAEENVAVQQQLRIAHDQVEQANQRKSAFLATMSHEIRTPLGAMLGFADLLSTPRLPEEDRFRYVEIVRRNGKALSQLIDDILDLSKVEAGKVTVETIEFELKDILLDLHQMFHKKALEKGIEFEIQMNEEIPNQFLSDPMRLRQILANLVGNAIKFTSHGRVTLTPQWMPSAHRAQSGQLYFKVTDTGIGVPPEAQLKLFHPFSQASDSTAREFGGTGLGLVLSRQLARLLGGDVQLEHSDAKQGTTFSLYIPVQVAASSSILRLDEVSLMPGKAPLPDGSCLKNVHILLAEDAPDSQLLITHILEATGAEVTVVGNGRDAVASALKGKTDLILMDIQMPVLGGDEAARELRSRGYDGPIIALTAHAMIEEKARSFALGYDDHLTKPIDSEKLIATIQSHIHLSS